MNSVLQAMWHSSVIKKAVMEYSELAAASESALSKGIKDGFHKQSEVFKEFTLMSQMVVSFLLS